MAPVDSSIANSNALPLVLLATQAGLIIILLGTITRFIFKHKKSIALFSLLALASLGLTTYHALAWRYASYQNWATQSGANTLNSLWDGWYANAQAVDNGFSLGSLKMEGWQLGRWMKDTNLVQETNATALGTGSRFWWTYQAFVGLVVWSIFVGVEGRHRNIPQSITLSAILLAQFASLSTAQSLFFVIMLLTPVPLSSGTPADEESHVLAPHPSLISVPALISFIGLAYLGQSSTAIYNSPLWTSITNAGYFALPLLLALLAQPNYLHKVKSFKSTHAARKSYEDIFRSLAFATLGLHAYFTYQAVATEAPPHRYLHHNYVWNTHSRRTNTLAGQAWGVLSSIAGALSDNPVISQVGWDVILSTLSLCLWAVVHSVDVGAMLRSSGLQWSLPTPSIPSLPNLPKLANGVGVGGKEPEKAADALEDLAEQIEISPLPTRSRGRGRPRKTSQQISKDHVYAHSVSSTTAASTSNSLRRSTRKSKSAEQDDEHEQEEQEDGEYQPTKGTEAEVDRYDFDEPHEEGLARETEAGVLAWGLFVLGGLGAVSSGVLGGECSGR